MAADVLDQSAGRSVAASADRSGAGPHQACAGTGVGLSHLCQGAGLDQGMIWWRFCFHLMRCGCWRNLGWSCTQDRGAKLAAIVECDRLGLAQAPLSTRRLQHWPGKRWMRCIAAPYALAPWGVSAGSVCADVLGKRSSDRVLLVGRCGPGTRMVRGWSLAGYLPAERYFGAGA